MRPESSLWRRRPAWVGLLVVGACSGGAAGGADSAVDGALDAESNRAWTRRTEERRPPPGIPGERVLGAAGDRQRANRADAFAEVWTGQELLVWGGVRTALEGDLRTGGASRWARGVGGAWAT